MAYVYAVATTKEYAGVGIGHDLFFTEADLTYLKTHLPEIELLSPEVSKLVKVQNNAQTATYELKGVDPSYFRLHLMDMKEGRLLHPSDVTKNSKVALIGSNVAEVLFDKQLPTGKSIQINDEIFTVVGIIADNLQNQYEARQIYLTYTSFKRYIDHNPQFKTLVMSLRSSSQMQKVQTRIRQFLNHRYRIHPEDDKAFYFNSMEEQVKSFNKLFSTIHKFLWFMGISTLLSGIIGVANIMYVSAKERTHEIGVRKAVGAKNKAIKAMFVGESIIITSIAGYAGLLLGICALKLIGVFIEPDNLLFEKPAIDIGVTIAATLVLIVAGTLAGLKPAAYAANLNPVDSLRAE
jgi:putative ABC transport system permease protein